METSPDGNTSHRSTCTCLPYVGRVRGSCAAGAHVSTSAQRLAFHSYPNVGRLEQISSPIDAFPAAHCCSVSPSSQQQAVYSPTNTRNASDGRAWHAEWTANIACTSCISSHIGCFPTRQCLPRRLAMKCPSMVSASRNRMPNPRKRDESSSTQSRSEQKRKEEAANQCPYITCNEKSNQR